MNINEAAVELSDRIFGEGRSFLRLGSVKPDSGILHVYTCVPPAKWPKVRAKDCEGFPIMWHWVPTAADKAAQQEAQL